MLAQPQQPMAQCDKLIAAPYGSGYLAVTPPLPLGAPYVYTPEQAREIARAAVVAVAREDATGLLIGGPRHGETIRVPNYDAVRAAWIPLPVGGKLTLAHYALPSEWPPMEDGDEYLATGSCTFYEGKMCQIFEHVDLPKQNVKRRADELDADIRTAASSHERAEDAFLQARQKRHTAEAKLLELWRERDNLRTEHGV